MTKKYVDNKANRELGRVGKPYGWKRGPLYKEAVERWEKEKNLISKMKHPRLITPKASPKKKAPKRRKTPKKKAPKRRKTPKRRKSPKKKASPKKKGCVESTNKKYQTRKSPPYPANECCGEIIKGNDGNMYESKPNKKGICAWRKVTNSFRYKMCGKYKMCAPKYKMCGLKYNFGKGSPSKTIRRRLDFTTKKGSKFYDVADHYKKPYEQPRKFTYYF